MNRFKVTQELEDSVREVMSSLIGNVIKVEFDEVEGYDFPMDEPFGLIVPYNGELYCFIIRFSSSNKNFICMGPGARDRKQRDDDGNIMRPPFFVRWNWFLYFEESVIAYADPMMFHSDDISVTWFAGDDSHWPLEDVALIIEKLAVNQNVIKENMLFFGSSGGGFSSIVLGTFIKNSKVMVNNAQFFVLNYRKKHVDELLDLLEEEFDGLSREEIVERIRYRLDAVELFKREKYAPFITYYMNAKSDIDIEFQCPQLIEGYYEIEGTSNMNIILYEDRKYGRTHDPLPTDETLDIIRLFCKNHLYNSPDDVKSNTIIKKGNLDDLILKSDSNQKTGRMNKLAQRFKKRFF